MNTISYILLLSSVTLASFSQILLKAAANKTYTSFIKQYLNVYVILGYGLTFTSMILTMLAYKNLQYKIGPVIESLGFIIVLVLGRIFFNEKITLKKLIGICLILFGISIYYL